MIELRLYGVTKPDRHVLQYYLQMELPKKTHFNLLYKNTHRAEALASVLEMLDIKWTVGKIKGEDAT